MNLKTFTANTMAEALVQVRRSIGADAVILHTRTYKRGGLLGFGARTVVEVTAADGREMGRRRRGAASASREPRLPRPMAKGPVSATVPTRSVADDAASRLPQDGPTGDLIRRTYAAAKAELERSRPAAVAAETVAARQFAQTADAQQLAEEMKAVKRMVARMMRQQQQRPADQKPDLPDKLFDQYLALLEQEVAEELAGEIVAQVRTSLTDAQLKDDKACREAVMRSMASLLPTSDDTDADGREMSDGSAPTRDGRPRTIALVGPTGVGKTTTIAKLAATFKLKQNQRVGLITLDTYRIAAVDQLRTYAGIIGVPLHVVMSPDELARAVEQCRDCDVVLIDTAGRSQRDDPRLEELAKFLEAARPHEVHLVLSSTCTQRVLEDTIERFSKIRTDRIIFTKLDEAVTFGVVLNVLRKVKKRLSYITTGQEVPHQIEPGRADRLAALVLGESAVRSGN